MDSQIKQMDLESKDLVAERIEQMKALFPEIATEGDGSIDFEKLRLILGDEVDEGDERYAFTWPGKADAIRQSQTVSTATLRPCPEESVDWDTTQNLYIEGDNLEVLKLLQRSYHGKVKMIYIDPPYNTGSDFIYKDNFGDSVSNYLKQTNMTFQSNADSSGRYHANWCSLMYPRLKLARELLRIDGVIFISIDNNEYVNLKKICDEIFGENSFVTTLHVEMSTVQGQKVRAAKAGNIVKNAEYILVYCKSGDKCIGKTVLTNPVKYDTHYSKLLRAIDEQSYEEFNLVDAIAEEDELISELRIMGLLANNKRTIATSDIRQCYDVSPSFKAFIHSHADAIVRVHDSVDVPADFEKSMLPGIVYAYNSDNRQYLVSKKAGSGVTQRIRLADKLARADDFYGTYGPTTIRGDWWEGFYLDMGNVTKEGDTPYPNAKKPIRLIYQLAKFCTESGDIVMDFFSGSATTAHAIMKLNYDTNVHRSCISIQLPENLDEQYEKYSGEAKKAVKAALDFLDSVNRPHSLSELGKERLIRAGRTFSNDVEARSLQLFAETEEQIIDTGFRVLKLDDSGIIQPKQGQLLIERIKTNRTDEDIIFEMMLKWGYELTYPIEKSEINGYPCYSVAADSLICCMQEGLTVQALQAIADLDPDRVLILDSILDDTLKLNALQIFKRAEERTQKKIDLRTV